MNEKPQKCMCMPKALVLFLPDWEDLLKFDTTAWNSYHWSIYCTSAKVDSLPMAIAQGRTFAINELDLWWHGILQWQN